MLNKFKCMVEIDKDFEKFGVNYFLVRMEVQFVGIFVDVLVDDGEYNF